MKTDLTKKNLKKLKVIQVLPFNCPSSRQSLSLALILLSMKNLPVEVAELHLIIVQQTKTPWEGQFVIIVCIVLQTNLQHNINIF